MKKENKSSAPKMLNRNWVVKRKRRKLPVGLDQFSGKEQSNGKEDDSATSESSRNASAKRMIKTEEATDRFSSKKRGNDGVSYFLCAEFVLLELLFKYIMAVDGLWLM